MKLSSSNTAQRHMKVSMTSLSEKKWATAKDSPCLQRLFAAFGEIEEQAQRNLDARLRVYMAYRDEAGLKGVQRFDDVKKMGSERVQDEGDVLGIDTALMRAIGLVEDEQDLLDFIDTLHVAISEFHHPPCFLTENQYNQCLKSLKDVRSILRKSPSEREKIPLVRFPFFHTTEAFLTLFRSTTSRRSQMAKSGSRSLGTSSTTLCAPSLWPEDFSSLPSRTRLNLIKKWPVFLTMSSAATRSYFHMKTWILSV